MKQYQRYGEERIFFKKNDTNLQVTVDANDLRLVFHPVLQMSLRVRRTLRPQDWPATRLKNAQ